MKTRFPSILGVFAAILMVASFVVPMNIAAPAAVSADPGIMKWDTVSTPGSIEGKGDIINLHPQDPTPNMIDYSYVDGPCNLYGYSDACVRDGIFPCRWSADSGKGYGEPLFNYYAQFPYWLAELVHISGLSLLDSAKVVYGLSLILSGLTMFLLARRYWGTAGGMVSAVLYLYAPYRAVDVWVRGALPEALAFIYYPLIIYFLDLYADKRRVKYILGFAIALALLVTTHNLSFVMFVPFLGVYWLVKSVRLKSFGSFWGLVAGGLLAFALSAYYLLPVIAESGLVSLSATTQGYYDFHIHFTTLNELFISRFWGYGASLWARKFLSVSIGQLHWILPLFLIVFGVLKRKINQSFLVFCLLGLGALFLTHGKSSFIWNLVPFMKYIQFPWRYLSIALFFLSLAGGYAALIFTGKFRLVLTLIIFICVVINFNFFRPDIWRNITDQGEYSGPLWDEGRSSSLTDFWPASAPSVPSDFAPRDVNFLQGSGFTETAVKKSQSAQYLVQALDIPGKISLPIAYFPGWTVYVNNHLTQIYPGGQLGLITLAVPAGPSRIQAVFKDTPIRTVGNMISLLALLISPVCLLKKYTG